MSNLYKDEKTLRKKNEICLKINAEKECIEGLMGWKISKMDSTSKRIFKLDTN